MFKFKHFTLAHNKCAHKIGTDSMVLGAWAETNKSPKTILDIGAGCGILSFMMAQKYPEAEIIAIEPDAQSFEDLKLNVSNHTFNIKATQKRLQDFHPDKKFDLIITNPPYYETGFLGVNKRRAEARHSGTDLQLKEIYEFVQLNLNNAGDFFTILPASAELELDNCTLQKVMNILDDQEKVIRKMYHYTKKYNGDLITHSMKIREEGKYTDAYKKLTKHFHGVKL